MPRDNNSTHEDILNSFIADDEDQNDLGGGNEDNDVDDDDDDDDDPTTEDVADDDDDDDDDDSPRNRRTDVKDDDDEETKKQERFSFKEDRAGNFVDKDGKIIFRAGKQREIFVNLKKRWLAEQKKNQQIIQKFGETVNAARGLLNRYNTLKAEKSYFDDKGLSKDEIKQAADMAVLMKVDPKAGIRKMLTILHMNGTDLKDIGVTGPVDAQEVARIIEQRSKPKEKTEEEKAREEATNFLNRHPAARQYTGMIAQAKRRFPHMTLDEIWFQLVMHSQKGRKDNREGGKRERQPDKVTPRNGSRDRDDSKRRKTKLSLNAVDPSQSFSQIGRDLLKDLQAMEGK